LSDSGVILRLSQIAFVLYNHIYVEMAQQHGLLIDDRSTSAGQNNLQNSAHSTEVLLKMHKFADRFKLSKSDMKIVKYLVELVKNAPDSATGSLKQPGKTGFSNRRRDNSDTDSMVLQYATNAEIKL